MVTGIFSFNLHLVNLAPNCIMPSL
ncbi:rCG59304 [Rattus norvegicus]|uniref:RCG59304 n=1 Tax=Rattus norvegicus TaxID=10116 RepID=A6K7Q1_RAT|nr:rCG59304 [Rattus norvegicus]